MEPGTKIPAAYPGARVRHPSQYLLGTTYYNWGFVVAGRRPPAAERMPSVVMIGTRYVLGTTPTYAQDALKRIYCRVVYQI